MIKIGSFLCSFIFLICHLAQAKGLDVVATVDRNEMAIGDTFTYSIQVSSDSSVNVEDPRLPSLDGFELLNQWSGVESRSTFANGTFEVVQSKTFNYMLAPQRSGSLVLGSATVVVEGQAHSTQPIQITVNQARGGQQARPRSGGGGGLPQDTFDDMDELFNQLLKRRMNEQGFGGGEPVNPDEAFFIQVEVDKKRAYVGEQVTATWYLYTRGQVHDIDTLKYPSLSGFWKEDIELATRLNFQRAVINGVVFQRALLASYALFPIKAGKSIVDPYQAKCTVSVPSSFGFGQPFQATKASPPVTIEVLDLPGAGKPASFTGAVGQFKSQASVSQTTVVQHQPLTVRYHIDGRGNAKLIDLPPLNLPEGVDVYDTKSDAKFFREGTSTKDFNITMIPRQAGALTIPAITAAAFDPQKNQYYEFATQPLVLKVLPGVAPANLPVLADATKKGSETPQTPTLPDLVLTVDASTHFSSLPMPAVWTLLYALGLAILVWRLMTEGDFIQRKRDVLKTVQTRAKKVRHLADAGQWRKVGTEGTNLIYWVLGQVSGLGGAGLEIEKLLLQAPPSVRREMAEPLQKTLSELELLSFAPETLVGAKKEKQNLRALVIRVEQQLIQAVRLAAKETKEKEDSGEVLA